MHCRQNIYPHGRNLLRFFIIEYDDWLYNVTLCHSCKYKSIIRYQTLILNYIVDTDSDHVN